MPYYQWIRNNWLLTPTGKLHYILPKSRLDSITNFISLYNIFRNHTPSSSLNMLFFSAVFFFFFSFGLADGTSAKMSVSSLNMSSSFVFGRALPDFLVFWVDLPNRSSYRYQNLIEDKKKSYKLFIHSALLINLTQLLHEDSVNARFF